jgi:hypothetical protein
MDTELDNDETTLPGVDPDALVQRYFFSCSWFNLINCFYQ